MNLRGLGKLFNLCAGEKLQRRNLCCLKSRASFVVTVLTTVGVDVPTVAKRPFASAASAAVRPQADNKGHYSSFPSKAQYVVDAIC
jgi:hypothetical protein